MKMKNKRPDQFDMEDNITELEMLLLRKKKILILEGSSDRSFFKFLLAKSSEDIQTFCMGEKGSKSCKTDLIGLFEQYTDIQDNNLVLGVFDKDLEEKFEFDFQNLLYTEFHDLDCYHMYFSSFERFVVEFLDEPVIAKKMGFNPSKDIEKTRNFIERALAPLSILRLINKDEKLRIPLNKILPKSPAPIRKSRYEIFGEFINHDLFIDDEKLIHYIVSHSLGKHLDAKKIRTAYVNSSYSNIKFFSNGHDLISLLTHLVNVGRRWKDDKDDLEIEESLRLSTDLNSFQEYTFTKKIMGWVLGEVYTEEYKCS